MNSGNRRYMNDVDDLIQSTPLASVLQYFGKDVPSGSSGEHRMQCVFRSECADSSYGQLAVNQDTPARVIYCHACGIRGNLLTLLHGLNTGRPPTGDKLRGDEFKASVATLRLINHQSGGSPSSPSAPSPTPAIAATDSSQATRRNQPLKSHDKEAARTIENLYEDLVTDPAEMPPSAAQYFRQRRQWLTPDVAEKWRMGYIPKNGRSLFRNWIVYAHHNVGGQVISYNGRSVNFEEQWQNWIKAGRPEDKRPAKHKYVKGYERGLELYGQMASRLDDDKLMTSLSKRGLIVVEGPNDVIRLDCLDVAAVGLCSNRATDEQVGKISQFAQEHGKGRVTLMPDNDDEGTSGFKELSWQLMERGLSVQLAWSSTMHDGQFAGKQPEDITPEEWSVIDAELRRTEESSEADRRS